MDPAKEQFTTGKPGVPPRIGSAGSRLRTSTEIHPFWGLHTCHKEDILFATASHDGVEG